MFWIQLINLLTCVTSYIATYVCNNFVVNYGVSQTTIYTPKLITVTLKLKLADNFVPHPSKLYAIQYAWGNNFSTYNYQQWTWRIYSGTTWIKDYSEVKSQNTFQGSSRAPADVFRGVRLTVGCAGLPLNVIMHSAVATPVWSDIRK